MSAFCLFFCSITRNFGDSTPIKNVFDQYFFDLKYYLQKDAFIEYFSYLLKGRVEKVDEISNFYYTLPSQVLVDKYRFGYFTEGNNIPTKANLSVESFIHLCGFDRGYIFLNRLNKIGILIIKQNIIII